VLYLQLARIALPRTVVFCRSVVSTTTDSTVHTISLTVFGEVKLVQYEGFLVMFCFTLTFNPKTYVLLIVGSVLKKKFLSLYLVNTLFTFVSSLYPSLSFGKEF
jgi:hypothetical protein